jgi:hypothetical protein
VERAKKKPVCLCATKFCRNRAIPGRRQCHKCKQRAWRRSRPFAAALATLRDHAKERGIACTIGLEDWTEFAITEGLFDAEGRRLETLTVDRKDATKPYEKGNLQVLTHAENVIKGNRERRTKYYLKNRWKTAEESTSSVEIAPADPDDHF